MAQRVPEPNPCGGHYPIGLADDYASSPSVWWNEGDINGVATDFLRVEVTEVLPAAPVLFLSVGEWEQSPERWELALPEAQREALRQH